MTARIRVLPDNTINKIAAGEVVENPASVVKELLENSLDAKADDIVIEIQGGGRQLIRITDNGCGMSRDDALLCLERHATSKIRAVEDIEHLGTMGFRGEAVPSIAAISKMVIVTCPQEATQGTMVVVEGGKILKCDAAARSPGTTLEVKSLFYNVPVRKRFQRSPNYDTAEIQRVAHAFALAHPEIRIRLISNRETLFQVPKGQSLQERIGATFGQDFLGDASEVDAEGDDIKLTGYIGSPQQTRPNRTGQSLFINGRAVQAPAVSFAVRDGYGTRLPQKRYPLFVLHLEMPSEDIDVNVHPQKREVRLRQEVDLKQWIEKAVDKALQKCSAPPPVMSQINELSWADQASIALRDEEPSLANWGEIRNPEPAPAPPPQVQQTELQLEPSCEVRQAPKVVATLPQYILVNGDDGLVIVKQRLAHARILFERMVERDAQQEPMQFQSLLMPIPIELTADQMRLVEKHQRELQCMGLSLGDFGGTTVALNGLAPHIKSSSPETLFSEALEQLQAMPGGRAVLQEKLQTLALTASRNAMTAQRLNPIEAQSLLNQLFECNSPYQCPHGKPVMAHLDTQAIDGLFQPQRINHGSHH